MKRVQLVHESESSTESEDDKHLYQSLSDEKHTYDIVTIYQDQPPPKPHNSLPTREDGNHILTEILQSQKRIIDEVMLLKEENRSLRSTVNIFRDQQEKLTFSFQVQLQQMATNLGAQLQDVKKELDETLNKTLFEFMDKQEKMTLRIQDELCEMADHLGEKMMTINSQLDNVGLLTVPVKDHPPMKSKKKQLPSL